MPMQGRRSHPRFTLPATCEGSLRVLNDVVVQAAGDERQLVAISPDPGTAAERLTLEVAGAGAVATLDVEVTESRPVIVDGSVRHRLRLAVRDVVTYALPVGQRVSVG
jgi:hypothetical protein